MQYIGVIIALVGLLFTVIVTGVAGVVYVIRLEGRLSAQQQVRDEAKRYYDAELAHIHERLATAITALTKFDEGTQAQVENYRTHTENKIDELGRNMSAKFEKVFDKLDQKQDKQK